VAAAELRARINFAAAAAEEQAQGFTVQSAPVLHPGGALAYRVAPEGDESNAVVFALDSELDGLAESDAPLAQLVTGARVLVHDAMYTVEEYGKRRGWGHSSTVATVELAMRLGVEMLVLHHHHPDRSDDDLDEMLLRCRELVAARSSPLKVVAACDGMELEL
jgi:ribonuclease BN (tRNA processing enzyme)